MRARPETPRHSHMPDTPQTQSSPALCCTSCFWFAGTVGSQQLLAHLGSMEGVQHFDPASSTIDFFRKFGSRRLHNSASGQSADPDLNRAIDGLHFLRHRTHHLPNDMELMAAGKIDVPSRHRRGRLATRTELTISYYGLSPYNDKLFYNHACEAAAPSGRRRRKQRAPAAIACSSDLLFAQPRTHAFASIVGPDVELDHVCTGLFCSFGNGRA